MEAFRAFSSVAVGCLFGSLAGYHNMDERWLWGFIGMLVGGCAGWLCYKGPELASAMNRAARDEQRWLAAVGKLKEFGDNLQHICVKIFLIFLGIIAGIAAIYAAITWLFAINYASWWTYVAVHDTYFPGFAAVTTANIAADMKELAGLSSFICFIIMMMTLSIADENDFRGSITVAIALFGGCPLGIAVIGLVLVLGFAYNLLRFAWWLAKGVFYLIVNIPWFIAATCRICVNAIILVHTELAGLVFACSAVGGGMGAYTGDARIGISIGVCVMALDLALVRPFVLLKARR